MTDSEQIDYEALALDALRGVVRTVLRGVAKTGLPGSHHFFIAFDTQAPGVLLSKRLMEKYPQEMTIVLQHRFWDLAVTDERFEVKLSFDGIPEKLVVPFKSIKVFFDPSVPYGLQFDEPGAGEDEREPDRGASHATAEARSDRKKTSRRSKSESAGEDAEVPAAQAKARATPHATRKTTKPMSADAGETKPAPAAGPVAVTGPVTATGDEQASAPAKRAGRASDAEPAAVDTNADAGAKVVSLDKFRKK